MFLIPVSNVYQETLSRSTSFPALFNSTFFTDFESENLETGERFSFGGGSFAPNRRPCSGPSLQRSGPLMSEASVAQRLRDVFLHLLILSLLSHFSPFCIALEDSRTAFVATVRLCSQTCWRYSCWAPREAPSYLLLIRHFCLIFKSKLGQKRGILSFKVVTEGHWCFNSGRTEISTTSLM